MVTSNSSTTSPSGWNFSYLGPPIHVGSSAATPSSGGTFAYLGPPIHVGSSAATPSSGWTFTYLGPPIHVGLPLATPSSGSMGNSDTFPLTTVGASNAIGNQPAMQFAGTQQLPAAADSSDPTAGTTGTGATADTSGDATGRGRLAADDFSAPRGHTLTLDPSLNGTTQVARGGPWGSDGGFDPKGLAAVLHPTT
jgi:hypothetical protein